MRATILVLRCSLLIVGAATVSASAELDLGGRLSALEAKISATQAELESLQTEFHELRAALVLETSKAQSNASPEIKVREVVVPVVAVQSPASEENPFIGRFPDDTVVTAGDWPHSITIPGTELSMRIGGFAQVDLIADGGDLATPDLFLVRAIDTQTARDEFLATSRATRINIDVRSEADGVPFRVFAEADFRGATGNELVSNSTSLRLRHAFGQFGDFYAGQWWSAFTNVQAFPETVDVISPLGKPVTRQAGVRYAPWLNENWRVGVSLENPEADVFRLPDDPQDSLDSGPDLVVFARFQHDGGHLRAALLGRKLGWTDGEREEEAFGYGFGFTLRQQLPWIESRDNIVFGLYGGEGIGRYFVNLAGGGFDALPSADDLETLWVLGSYGGFQHWWSEQWRSTFTLGTLAVESQLGPADSQLERVSSASANLFWNPHPRVTFGGELLFGLREDRDGEEESALRAHFLSRFNF